MADVTAYLVETIPLGLEALARPDTHHTADVLLRLVSNARKTIDLTAVYWSLLHHPDSADEAGFSAQEMAAFGAQRGHQLYEELVAAAARGVQIRILQSPGFLPVAESATLAADYPEQVHVRQVELDRWYGGGILHQKSWLVDGRHAYVGSANMDWRALSQVKEFGIAVENDPALVADLTGQYEIWWQFSALTATPVQAFDDTVGLVRAFPCWSPRLPDGRRCPPPFAELATAAPTNLDRPLPVRWNGRQATAFVSTSPPALCAPGRTHDLDAVRHTIDSAEARVSIGVMHFAPLSPAPPLVRGVATVPLPHGNRRPLWWPVLFDALLQAVCRGVEVRLLVGRWPYSPPTMEQHLRALVEIAAACSSAPGPACGQLQVRLFTIPGWDSTVEPGRRFPGHSRVNHPKFVVSERRLNVGTSNLSWGDFALNGGLSLNTDHPALVREAQEIFDRDWHSPYAQPLLA